MKKYEVKSSFVSFISGKVEIITKDLTESELKNLEKSEKYTIIEVVEVS